MSHQLRSWPEATPLRQVAGEGPSEEQHLSWDLRVKKSGKGLGRDTQAEKSKTRA